MSHYNTPHTKHGVTLERLSLYHSHWPDENGGPVSSVLVIDTGAAHVQTNISADQIDHLITMLQFAAASLRTAEANREALAQPDPTPRDLAAEWDAIPAPERATLTAAFAAGFNSANE